MLKKKRQTSDALDNDVSTDSSEEKTMLSTTPSFCQHIKQSVDTIRLRKTLKLNGVQHECHMCSKAVTEEADIVIPDDLLGDNSCYEVDNTLWMCLRCGTQLCGRAKNQHALQHFKTPHSDSHALAMNTQTFLIWCYECDNEVNLDARKNLHECVDMIKRMALKSPTPTPTPTANTTPNNIALTKQKVEEKILATWETIQPLVCNDPEVLDSNIVVPLPPAPGLPLQPIPGKAKRVIKKTGCYRRPFEFEDNYDANVISGQTLPRVRGLTNLGNTCFFNAVLQCLAQTPFLLDVLKESSEPGEEFILPGGTFKFKDDENVELPMIQGKLSSWGPLTSALANALEELQSGGGIFSPSKLFEKLCMKCPQFRGGDQHDSHELLRQLLESVRSEDLKRYQRVILQSLGYKDQESVSDEMRQKCKIYGNQAADRILRPDQVFRGFLVSTLTCQSCFNVSSRHEYFLDLSLPVAVEKPQVPQRRKTSPENKPSTSSFFLDPLTKADTAAASTANNNNTKSGNNKSKRRTVKSRSRRNLLESGLKADENAAEASAAGKDANEDGVSSASSYEESDADVEDNLLDDNVTENRTRAVTLSKTSFFDTNGNNANTLPSPGNPEKRDDSPENMDKDSLDEDENDSGIATSPAYTGSSHHLVCSATNAATTANGSESNSTIVAMGLSMKSATMVRQLSSGGTTMETTAQNSQTNAAENEALATSKKRAQQKRARTHSYSDWSTTIAPRIQCEDGECSVQSCLNNFTGVELMTGNNKVGCENCTKNKQASKQEEAQAASKPKTVYTNATKQFLISSPPAVLILHLKRFQLGPRCIFRKLTRNVSYPLVLDIAPFCGSKVKNLPNIDRKQKKLLYALYGIVEHAGSMYGGHYTAYVKVRAHLSKDDKRWKFIPQGSKAELDQDDEQRKKLEELLAKEKARELRLKALNDSDDFSSSESASGTTSNTASAEESDTSVVDKTDEASHVEVPPGNWYYVSDSMVHEVTEETVLQSQAYLLFYERIY